MARMRQKLEMLAGNIKVGAAAMVNKAQLVKLNKGQ
jgi:hypothetical protein